MSIKEQLVSDLTKSMREKDSRRTLVIRMLMSSVRNAEISKNSSLSDEEIVSVIKTEKKKVLDSIEQFKSAGREDLFRKEQEDLEVIQKYLPSLLDESSTRILVREAINNSHAKRKEDLGKVMGLLMSGSNKSRLDGKLVNKIVVEELLKN